MMMKQNEKNDGIYNHSNDGIISKLTKDIPFETTLQVMNEIAFINLIHELGYRKSKTWDESEDELLNKLLDLSHKHTLDILEKMKENNV